MDSNQKPLNLWIAIPAGILILVIVGALVLLTVKNPYGDHRSDPVVDPPKEAVEHEVGAFNLLLPASWGEFKRPVGSKVFYIDTESVMVSVKNMGPDYADSLDAAIWRHSTELKVHTIVAELVRPKPNKEGTLKDHFEKRNFGGLPGYYLAFAMSDKKDDKGNWAYNFFDRHVAVIEVNGSYWTIFVQQMSDKVPRRFTSGHKNFHDPTFKKQAELVFSSIRPKGS